MPQSNDQRSIQITHYALLITYLAIAILFAVTTPDWQNPDEPAHYNYIAHIAAGKGLPYLQMGDYDQAYLSRLTSERFPPELSIEPVRYESHQPPLYYMIAAPIFWISGGNLLLLRLFNVLIGLGIITLIFLTVRRITPGQPHIALGAAAFVAFLPMHVAILASVNNDPLAGLILAATMYVLVRWTVDRRPQTADRRPQTDDRRLQYPIPDTQYPIPDPQSPVPSPRSPVPLLLGLLMGLGFLTKATTYVLLPVVVMTVFVVSWRRWGGRSAWIHAALTLPWALLLGMPLWLRNIYLYGGFDFLGLRWHDLVVTGQPTTADWIATHGWAAYLERAWHFTFSSFWGVFGWMGVFMDSRVYTALLILSGIILFGLITLPLRIKNKWPQWSSGQRWSLLPLLLLLLGVIASYGWYNLGFVQHQGRYLFPALLSVSMLFAVGWHAVLRPPVSLACAAALLLGTFVVAGVDIFQNDVNLWTILLMAVAATGLLLNAALALRNGWWSHPHPLLYALPFLLLALLDAVIPFLYIGPQL
jgi:4-amino-4-deoxy-L-arabinose transferase-like glycosyltransferase